MITATALGKICQQKDLDIYQNLTIGTRKVYAITKAGQKDVLTAGYLGYIHKFVKAYQP